MSDTALALIAVGLWVVGMVTGCLPIFRKMSHEGAALAIVGFFCLLGSAVLVLTLIWRAA